ncbi:MAG: GDSL-type esterase/lipase family protein [Verrucomicrobiales bacterium]
MTNSLLPKILLCVVFAAGSISASAQDGLAKNDRIVFLGDSITAAGARPRGYITMASEQLKQLHPELNLKLIGAGIGGHKVPDCQKRLQTDVLDHKPTIVFIYIGINDVWHWSHPKVVARGGKGTTQEDFESGLHEMVQKINEAGARVILCTPTVIGEKFDGTNPDDQKLDEYANISRKVATETKSQLLDLRMAFIAHLKANNPQNVTEGILTSDSVHLNEAGNKLVAELVVGALIPTGEETAATGAAERGRTLYSQLCFNCHGHNLEGGQGPALNDSYWQHGSSPEAILKVINKGVPGSPMIPYEAVFPEADRMALRDFILSKQEGLRETVRSIYPRDYFAGKRFTPELFNSIESLSQTPLPENHYYAERNTDGILRGQSKLYISEANDYTFSARPNGRTSIFLDGGEVFYSDEKTDKSTHVSKTISLQPGVYDLEIFHEEKTAHSYRFSGSVRSKSGRHFVLNGRSLQGNIPKFVRARPGEAQVVRKWINGLPSRALLCLLPNQVIVAYHPVDGRVLAAWHSAEINQTPSLPDRSAKPSEINGESIEGAETSALDGKIVRFLRYEIQGESAVIVSQVDGQERTLVISPKGESGFALTNQ